MQLEELELYTGLRLSFTVVVLLQHCVYEIYERLSRFYWAKSMRYPKDGWMTDRVIDLGVRSQHFKR